MERKFPYADGVEIAVAVLLLLTVLTGACVLWGNYLDSRQVFPPFAGFFDFRFGALFYLMTPLPFLALAARRLCYVVLAGLEITDEAITEYGVLGQKLRRIPWTEVTRLSQPQRIRQNQDRDGYRYRNVSIFAITSPTAEIRFSDQTLGFSELFQTIKSRLPSTAVISIPDPWLDLGIKHDPDIF